MKTKLFIALALVLSSLAIASFPKTATADYYADFSKGTIKADFHVRSHGCDNNPYYKGSYRLTDPNESYIEGTFRVKNKPKNVLITLKHLSSFGAGQKRDGESPIRIVVNGNTVVRRFDPGSHSYVKDTFNITKYIREGNNTIRIQYLDGTTHYWIKWLLIETD